MLYSLLYYFGNALCFIPTLFKKNKNIPLKNRPELVHKRIIELIYNNPYDQYLETKDIIIILILSVLFLLQDFFLILSNLIDLNETENNENSSVNIINNQLYFIEFLIWFLFAKFCLKETFYRHQYISISGIMIIGAFKWIYINCQNFNKWKVFKFFLELGINIIDILFFGYVKGLMKYKFFSPYKCCYIFGMINFPIVLIAFIILCIIPCENKFFCEKKGHFASIFPILSIEQNNNKYLTEIFKRVNKSQILTIIIIIIHIFLLGLNSLLINTTMEYFTIFHIIILVNIGIFTNIFISIFSVNDINIFLIISMILELLMYLVFLEVIELNFCGLSTNIKKNIKERAISDVSDLMIDGDHPDRDSFYNNEDEKDNEGELIKLN